MGNTIKKLQQRTWRTEATQAAYIEARATYSAKPADHCPLCESKDTAVYESEHWLVIPNKFPYDAVAHRHDQVIPKRHTDGSDLTAAELAELKELKATMLGDRYNLICEALPGSKSIPGHYHLHLITPKVMD